jgi:hypothetical protein
MQPELKRLLSRPDPMLTFRWEVKSVPFADFGVDSSYVESFELPFNNVKSTGVFFAGGYDYFPEFHDISAFNVTFYADVEGRAMNYLMAWKTRVKSFSTGLYNVPQDFKGDWVVAQYDNKGNEIVEYTFGGCWPADTGQISLDYSDGSGRITFNQNFSVDGCTIKIGKNSY